MREKIAMMASFMMTAVSLLFVLLLAAGSFGGDGAGLFALSVQVRHLLAGAAVFFGAVAWLFSKFGRHTRVRRIRRPRPGKQEEKPLKRK